MNAPRESDIRNSVEKLSAGDFQRLAERYAQITRPQLFKHIIPKGRNPDYSTVSGWPDALALLPDGQFAALEATTWKGRWRQHLEVDLQHATDFRPHPLGGFMFVTRCPTPDPEAISHFHKRLVATGIPAENIALVFQAQLIAELTRPVFASVWGDLLGLRTQCLPFLPIMNAPILRTSHEPGAFAPTREEYLQGKVHRPAVINEVEESLDKAGWSLVRGRGASGKTVLGVLIALGEMFREQPTYYLDLIEMNEGVVDANAERALEAVTARADGGVLFVIDNVHRNEELARSIFDHWRQVAQGSRLLLLGRSLSADASPKGLASPLADIEPDAQVLQVTPDDLAGVYGRLADRTSRQEGVTRPPEEVLRAWLSVFGADLIAFSAAVSRRLADLLRDKWDLEAADAVNHVWAVCLEPCSAEEQHNLLILATLAVIELAVPAEALDSRHLRHSLRTGLVHRSEHGQERYVRYGLVHTGVGQLIDAALRSPTGAAQIFRDVAVRSAFTGAAIASRLLRAGREDEAADVLTAVAASPSGLVQAIAGMSVATGVATAQLFAHLTALTEEEIDECLAKNPPLVTAAALRTPLHFLHSFLQYAETSLPKVHEMLSRALTAPENLEALGAIALHTPLHFLASFLQYAETSLPKVHEMLSRALTAPENLEALGAVALRTPLGYLGFFLRYAERGLPPEVGNAVSRALTAPENLETLRTTALRTPLEGLASFSRYASNTAPLLKSALDETLAEPAVLSQLAAAAVQSPPDGLLSFLRTADIAQQVVGAISQADWEQFRSSAGTVEPHHIAALAKELNRLGRPELAEAPARAVICSARPESWHRAGVGLHHVSHSLRLAHSAPETQIVQFADRVLTREWLDGQYGRASAGTIAGALYSIWAYQEDRIIERFRTESLRERLLSALGGIDLSAANELSAVLQLLGSCALLRLYVTEAAVRWPGEDRVRGVLEMAAPTIEMTAVGHIQVQLWTGLREMARLRKEPVAVPPQRGDQVLTLWRKAEGHTARHKSLNVAMTDWLERCAESGWVLLPDIPIAAALRHAEGPPP